MVNKISDSKVITIAIERYPSKPYIKEGHPGNITVLVNDTVQLTCPPVSDLEPHLYWVRPMNYSVKDSEVGPSDAPAPIGDVVEVPNWLLGGGSHYFNNMSRKIVIFSNFGK